MSRLISLHAEGFANNSCFDEVNTAHRHAPTDLYRAFRQAFLQAGYALNTVDVNLGQPVVADLYIEGQTLPVHRPAPRFLLAYENPIFNPLNEDTDYFTQFDRVFTWNPETVTAGNVDIQMVPNRFIERAWAGFDERPLLLSLINANKAFRNPVEGDLYKARLALIRYCEKHQPEAFRLYGRGWDKPTPSYGRAAKLKRSWIRLRTKAFGYRPFPSYVGEVADKHDVYATCRFAVCYENFSGWRHYITEKIFDAFFSGCVPVYWGAPDVTDFIPSECFIDRRLFQSDAELLKFLQQMDAVRFGEYQAAIRAFLSSPVAARFELDRHVNAVVADIISKLQAP